MSSQPNISSSPDNYPLIHFEGEIRIITSTESLESFLPELTRSNVLGFDTETRPSFQKGVTHKVSLVQLFNGETAYLIRLFSKEMVRTLAVIFENANIIKAGVAIRDDIKLLQQIANFKPQGFVELQTMAKELGINDISLKKLTEKLLHFRISKRQQTSNWSQETLTNAQILYAATDAWVSYLIYQELIKLKKHNNV